MPWWMFGMRGKELIERAEFGPLPDHPFDMKSFQLGVWGDLLLCVFRVH
jgi:hypothetical protein